MNGRGSSTVIFLIFGPLQWACFLSYNNIIFLKRSHFLWGFMIFKKKIHFKVKKLKKFNFTVFTHVTYACYVVKFWSHFAISKYCPNFKIFEILWCFEPKEPESVWSHINFSCLKFWATLEYYPKFNKFYILDLFESYLTKLIG